jgi:carbon monoxide dehydrogenase subunit G
MKVVGEATLHGSAEQVYAALTDPAVLVRTIPGCERLEQVGPDAYTMTVSAGVAAVKGVYVGDVVLTDQRPPHELVLKASGSGAPGTVSATARIRLAPGVNGTTTVTYDADAVVGGMVGGVGQRLLTSVTSRTVNEFFAAVDDVLTGPAPSAAEAPVETAAPSAAEAVSPVVFTRPVAERARGGRDLTVGIAVGALAALVGVAVGVLITRGQHSRR